MAFVVAMDGPAGTGKGTITDILAKKFNLTNIGTGDAYRAVTLYLLKNQIPMEDEKAIIEAMEDIHIEMNVKTKEVLLNGKDVTDQLRSKEVSNWVSKSSNIKEVRLKLNELFRTLAADTDVIMEGRDITTVVFPEADVKIYLDAIPEERAKRRTKQNQENGIDIPYEEVLENIRQRDENDKTKPFGALVVAKDATIVDSTDLSIEEVVIQIEKVIDKKKKEIAKMEEKTEQKAEIKSQAEEFKGIKSYFHEGDSWWKKLQKRLAWSTLRGIYKVIFRVKILGEENVPKEGSFILCGNHVSFIKVPIIVLFTPRKVNFIAKAELFKNPVLDWLGSLFDVIPVKRGKQDMESMKRSIKVLNSGEVLGLFPEGTTNGLAKKVKVKNGASYMSIRTGKQVVPVGIDEGKGTFSKITVRFGKPLDYSKFQSKVPEKEVLETVTEEIMGNIIELTNPTV